MIPDGEYEGETTYRWWHPAEVPGDGAEMEDKLRIHILWWSNRVTASAGATADHCDDFVFTELFADHNDEGTARRWASLRVAAAIGRAMK
jgi:hypothetical protein